MLKVWGRLIKNNKIVGDTVVTIDDETMTRTHMVFAALDKICIDLDLAKPIWLDSNISDFKRSSRTRFTPDSFIETVNFDYLDFYVIEED